MQIIDRLLEVTCDAGVQPRSEQPEGVGHFGVFGATFRKEVAEGEDAHKKSMNLIESPARQNAENQSKVVRFLGVGESEETAMHPCRFGN